MKNKISTSRGDFFYAPINLYCGRKVINVDVCKRNLLDFKKILDDEGILFGLIFGTLLGAIRENNFIKHDEDVDVFVLDENRHELLATLFMFEKYGFKVARYTEYILSLIRNDEYIDIYFFKEATFNRYCMNYVYSSKYFQELIEYDFLDTKFTVPKHYIKFLEEIYGHDWKIPKHNAHAEQNASSDIITNCEFSLYLNTLLKQLRETDKSIVIYGNGVIGKTIYEVLKDKIVAFVDQKSDLISNNIIKGGIYNPKNLLNMKYDLILVSVIGRDNEIIEYLQKELHIDEHKIIAVKWN